MGEKGRAIVVALDGPAGAGKSTIARRTAQALGFTLLDTGALYRVVALACEREGVPWNEDAATAVAERLVRENRMRLEPTEGSGMRILLDGVDVSALIRTPSISMGASTVSAVGGVRHALLDVQRDFAKGVRGLVCEGRDIGTVIFPHADVKIFLTASVDERAQRRHGEFLAKDATMTLDQTRQAVIERDAQDENRKVAPLRRADDAVVVDSTGSDLEATVEKVIALVREKLAGEPR
ncbi:MAG: (d)CMP kinase [Polyangiales bacterium]